MRFSMKLFEFIKEKFFNRQFLTFGIIGACNTLISQGLYMVFVLLKIAPGIASLLGDALSMIFSYVMNMKFTYKQPITLKGAITFPLSYVPGMIISALIVVLVVDVAGAPELWAKLISLPIYIPINFLCMNFIVKKFGSK